MQLGPKFQNGGGGGLIRNLNLKMGGEEELIRNLNFKTGEGEGDLLET